LSEAGKQVQRGWKLDGAQRRVLERFLIGAFFAAALFLSLSGISSVLIAKDEACKAIVLTGRMPEDPEEVCLSLVASKFIIALGGSRAGVLSGPWIVNGVVLAIAGGLLAQMRAKWAVPLFVALYLAFLGLLTMLGVLSDFVISID